MKYTFSDTFPYKWLLFLSLFIPYSITAQLAFAKSGPSKGPVPSWVQDVQLSGQSTIKAEDISDGYNVLLRDYQFYVEKRHNFYHLVRKIYSTTGVQKGSEIEVSYDPSYERVVFHQIRVIRGNKSIDKLDVSKFKVMQREQSKESYIYDESLSALLILEDVREGDIIEYSYSLIGRNPIYDDKFFTYLYLAGYDPIDRLFIKVISPLHRPLQIKSEHTTHLHTHAQEGGNNVYQWDLQNLAGVHPDDDLPYWYNPYPSVWISEYATWKQVNDWAVKLYATSNIPGKKLAAAIESIKKAYKTKEGRLEAALEVVQNEVRYTGLEAGIGGYKPRNPSDVYEQKFGDCKDKALLLCYMLRQMEISAYPALVNTTYQAEINNWLPSPHAFNHCVAMVELAGKTYWYDPTTANQGGGYNNMYFPNYKTALVIKENTNGLTQIPLSTNTKTKVEETFLINDMSGTAEVSITTEYIGYEADDQRYYFSTNNIKEIEKNYLNYASKHYAEIEISKPLLTSDNKQTNVFTTYENYKITNFWYAPDSTKPGSLECLTYPQTLRDKIVRPQGPKRTMPLGIYYPLNYEHKVNIVLPENWPVTEENIKIESAASLFNRKVTYKRGVITITYSYKTLKNYIQASETAGFIKKQNQIINNLGYMLYYTKEGSVEASKQINWLMIGLTIVFLGISLVGVYNIYKYDPAPDQLYAKDKPAQIGGWLYVIAFGLVTAPLTDIVVIVKNDYYDLTVWENLIKDTSLNYNPKLALLIVAEMFYYVFSFVYSILLIILFFKRRTSFPILMSINYAYTFLFINLETYLLYEMGHLNSDDTNDTIKQLTKLIISGAIWIPYLYISERSKETFLNTLKVPEGIQEVYKLKA